MASFRCEYLDGNTILNKWAYNIATSDNSLSSSSSSFLQLRQLLLLHALAARWLVVLILNTAKQYMWQCEKGPLGGKSRFWVLYTAWKYSWWAFRCTLLRFASWFRFRDTLAQSVELREVCYQENSFKTFTSGKTTTFCILPCHGTPG